MRPRYVVRIGPEDVGRRVSVRFRTHAGEGQPSATDAVGILRSWEGGRLTVERRDGTVADIREGDVLAARPVGATPKRHPE